MNNWILKDGFQDSTSIFHVHEEYLVRATTSPSQFYMYDTHSVSCVLCFEEIPDYIKTQIKLLNSYPSNYDRTPFCFFSKDPFAIIGLFSHKKSCLYVDRIEYKKDLCFLLLKHKFIVNEIKSLHQFETVGFPF